MVLLGSTDIEDREGQPEKAPPLILVTELGIVTEVRLVHSKKASDLIIVTLYTLPYTVIVLGIVISPVYLLSPLVTSAVFSFRL